VNPPWSEPLSVSATAFARPYGRVAPGKTLPIRLSARVCWPLHAFFTDLH